jgi:polysaccharide deacetylase family protein (PEP-CTERM system associated)
MQKNRQATWQTTYSRPSDNGPVPVDALSVDVEDYFHVEAFASKIPYSQWPQFPQRVRENTLRVLDLFAEHDCRATFFVLGWVAEREPRLVREIAERGHEVACHSYAHRRVFTMTRAEFREDLRRARAAIEDAAGLQIFGYRAPTFSIRRDSLWALEILAEEGFLYDSSIFPIRHDLYGSPGAPRFAHRMELSGGRSIVEVPMSTARLGSMNLPVGGGGYLRLLPMSYTRWALRWIHRRENQPAILYFHPWEIDLEQPRLVGSWKSRFRHYTGLKRMESRLRNLLRDGRYKPMIELVQRLQAEPCLPAGNLGFATTPV